MVKVAYLYGGGGYLGYYMAKELIRRGCTVVNIDKQRYNKVKGVLNLVPCAWSTLQQTSPVVGDNRIVFFHLACPRNKPGEWDLGEATDALEEGIILSKKLGAKLYYASSLSIHDSPPSEYGNFKQAAEVAVRTNGGTVARFGTLFGGACGPYRADLGLHIIAETLAAGKEAWVNSEIQRYICRVEVAARELASMWDYGQDMRDIHAGLIRYADMVPAEVPRRLPEKDFFTIEGEPTADTEAWSNVFNKFVANLKGEHVWPI